MASLASMTRRKGSDRRRANSPPGRLRIVAGKWRGRLLKVADVAELRPTSARIRETLFSWLTPHLHGAACLDLFAGSGALGFEALSRGVRQVTFVEKNRIAVGGLRAAIAALEAERATVVQDDAYRYLDSAAGAAWDVVFLDPPYAADCLTELCKLLAEESRLAPGAHVYFEQDREHTRPLLPEGWTLLKEKTAGQVRYALASTPGSGVS